RTGTVLWSNTYGTAGDDFGLAVQVTGDGGFILAGETGKLNADSADVYLIRMNAAGAVLWSKRYGGNGDDGCQSVEITPDKGFFIAGYTNSFGAGDWDFYLLKTDSNGTIQGCGLPDPLTLVNSAPTVTFSVPTKTGSGAVTAACVSSTSSGGTALFCSSTGIAENSTAGNGVRFYPNPFRSTATVKMEHAVPDPHTKFSLFDMLGQEVLQSTLTGSETEIQRGSLSPGVYFYRVEDAQRVIGTGKVVIVND
ncbi:MAG TPA: T9SS type A sorting domain-containing protein, partial [Bacteroidia bacterium]|nr:T9SS type A sorting domain-containing protein [Bacteroidia bacterium]